MMMMMMMIHTIQQLYLPCLYTVCLDVASFFCLLRMRVPAVTALRVCTLPCYRHPYYIHPYRASRAGTASSHTATVCCTVFILHTLHFTFSHYIRFLHSSTHISSHYIFAFLWFCTHYTPGPHVALPLHTTHHTRHWIAHARTRTHGYTLLHGAALPHVRASCYLPLRRLRTHRRAFAATAPAHAAACARKVHCPLPLPPVRAPFPTASSVACPSPATRHCYHGCCARSTVSAHATLPLGGWVVFTAAPYRSPP